jgi:hypothetical protein
MEKEEKKRNREEIAHVHTQVFEEILLVRVEYVHSTSKFIWSQS